MASMQVEARYERPREHPAERGGDGARPQGRGVDHGRGRASAGAAIAARADRGRACSCGAPGEGAVLAPVPLRARRGRSRRRRGGCPRRHAAKRGTGGRTVASRASRRRRALAPTDPAPAPLGGDPPVLDASVGPIEFPDWQQKFGWRAVGGREDEVSGRPVTTVFYRNPDGARTGLLRSSTASPRRERPPAHPVTREGKTYHVSNEGAQHRRHLDPAGPHLHLRRLLDRPRGESRRTGGVPEHMTT